ncbi:MAG: hypothetical protein K2N53_03875, partial [Clostridia bacterium]|nr:hypothetical protein [Clostridia bacterium]
MQVNVLSGSTIECVYKQKQTISVEMGDMPIGNDTISLNFIASLGGTDIPLKNDVIINADSNSTFDVELATDNLPITGEWELKIQLKDGVSTSNSNYKLLTADTKLNVTEVTNDGDLSWRLWTDGGSVTSIRIPIGTFSTTYTDTLIYDGKLRTFEAGTPRGYSVNTSYSKNDFVGGYKTEASRSGNDNIGISADTYTTYVAIIKDGETEPEIYSIAWTINKALFDLSSVTWKNNGKLQYAGDTVYAELENLPTGLTATCSNNEGLSVGEGGTASVRFALTGDYAINYELPAQGGKGVNYTFSGSGDFEWTKVWEVVKAEIKVGQDTDWTTKSHTDDDGNTYNIPVLVDKSADGVVEYEYYETDSHGNILAGTQPIELGDIEYSVTQRKYYKALPKIIDTANYTFTEGVTEDKYYSPFFSVGGGANQVSVSIATDKIEYNGKPRNVKLVISGSGATLNDFTLTYYSGDVADETHKLEGAPTERGNYLVVITSNKNSVVLNGTTQYTFEIIAATIKKEWNKDAKPYVLNLKYGQIDGIKYEIVDAQGNPVEYSQLSAGNKYQIKAVIKEEMRNNYSFTDGTYETAWEEFELRAEDIPNMQD